MKLQGALAETFDRRERDLRHRLAKKLWECRRDNLNLKLYARCLFDILLTEGNISCVDCSMGSECQGPKKGELNSPRNISECVYRKAAFNSFRTHLENDTEVRRAFMSVPTAIVTREIIMEHGKKFNFGRYTLDQLGIRGESSGEDFR